MYMQKTVLAACLVLLLTFLAGCSTTQNAPPPPVAKVSGKVNLDGKPMASGEVSFNFPGQIPKNIQIKDGEFAGEAYVGKNQVQVVLQKDGPPATTDMKEPTKIN